MKAEDKLRKHLDRISRWSERFERVLKDRFETIDELYKEAVSQMDQEKKRIEDDFNSQEEGLRAQLDEAGKDYAQKKYKLERDSGLNRGQITKIEDELQRYRQKVEREMNRINEEKLKNQISYEKQRSALMDMYQQQKEHLLKKRGKLLNNSQRLGEELKNKREKFDEQIAGKKEEFGGKINTLKDQLASKQKGWNLSLEVMKRNLESLIDEKNDLEKKITTIKTDKEKELEALRLSAELGREQLEVDKATLVERAEGDQRQCEAEVTELVVKVEKAERELQDLIVTNDKKRKDTEESYEREEALLKETLKSEAEKRDYEQKAFEQERLIKEKELIRLREDYEKKKWHWENQIRTLMMQKSVQDAEFDGERMRVDREARTVLRNLEARRDELKQRMAELKNRYASLESNAKKEMDLMGQRWNWRKNRLWTMWQDRLDALKKERTVLNDQMDHLVQTFIKEQAYMTEKEKREENKIEDMQQFVLHVTGDNEAKKKQKEIQFELEKTRIIAQIRECEALIVDWKDRIKLTQDEVSKSRSRFGEQLSFVERLLRDEERESEVFLHGFQRALSTISGFSQVLSEKNDAA